MTAMVSERRSSRVVSERISAIRPSKYYGMSKDKLKEPGALDQRRQTVKDAMSPHNTREEFRRLLKTENIDAIFRINPIGRIYGVTFIDHNAGTSPTDRYWERSFQPMSSTTCIRHRKRDVRLQNSDIRNENSTRKVIRPIP